ncbi:DUF5691 domain-containing protein [Streptomyces sp. NPDC050560]|uniref:DUF5691 domain-containing protein n=1 Tax=Streptomyces sp. NPDC050560 TaxID=3365630 RepID=UPI0037AA2727
MTTGNGTTEAEGARAGLGVPWEELVTAALLGTERRRPPVPPAGRPAPVALLDAAAVRTVWRRAGLRPAPARQGPGAVAPDPRPALPPAAADRLATLLADRQATSGRRGTTPDLKELLPQWLAAANAGGFAAPPELVPALLDAARGRTDLRPQVLAFTGARARWLAGLNPDWKFALRAAGSPAGDGAPVPRERAVLLWDEGLFAERVALLSALRSQDRALARELLAGTWAKERAEDRLMFLDSLRFGLEADDEPFLERALADRSRNVRAVAAELLSALPGSALAARMAERAFACVSLDETRQALVVEPPRGCDAAMERDGVVQKPPSGRGERAWWFGQVVEATPLRVWGERFGGRTPSDLVGLAVDDGAVDWAHELHGAWCRAAVRQRDAEWSRALLDEPAALGTDPEPPVVSLAERSKLLAALPARARAEWVAGFIAAHGLSEAFQLLGGCAVPWAEPLGGVVVDALNIARDSGSYPWSFSGVMGLAERCLDPSQAPRLEALTAVPEDGEDSSPGAGAYWAEAFQRLASTLRLRAAMHAELAAPGGAEGGAGTG